MRIVFLAAALVCVCGSAAAQYAPYEPEWNQPAIPHRVVGNIYYVGSNELSVFLVATPKGHILIESGFAETVPLVKQGIRDLGFRYEDVRILLNTQAHFDHAAGLAMLKRETGAQLYAMGPDAPLLASGGRNDFRFGNELTFAPVKVDRVLKDGDRVELGGVSLVARHTPGHTKGSTTFETTVEEGGRRYSVAFVASLTVNPGTRLVRNAQYRSIVADWEKTYRVMKSLRPDVWLAAHASAFGMAGKLRRIGSSPSPYVDPEGYERYVERAEQRFRAQLAEERRAATAGRP